VLPLPDAERNSSLPSGEGREGSSFSPGIGQVFLDVREIRFRRRMRTHKDDRFRPLRGYLPMRGRMKASEPRRTRPYPTDRDDR
jgi:hypothetical protein